MESTTFDLTSLTSDIVSAYVANNALSGDKIPELISSVYGALRGLRSKVLNRRRSNSNPLYRSRSH